MIVVFTGSRMSFVQYISTYFMEITWSDIFLSYDDQNFQIEPKYSQIMNTLIT